MQMSNPLCLEDLIGQHTLYAVDCAQDPDKHADQIRFQLGRVTYVATEGPDDGYRSSMEGIEITRERIEEGRLPRGVPVIAQMAVEDTRDVLQLYHARTRQVILEVGTDNADGYYPCWVASYWPENTGLDLTGAGVATKGGA